MNARGLETRNGNLTGTQLKTFKKFQHKLRAKVPDYHLGWVRPYSETIIEIGLNPQKKMTYRKTMQASKIATEVEDATDMTIVLL